MALDNDNPLADAPLLTPSLLKDLVAGQTDVELARIPDLRTFDEDLRQAFIAVGRTEGGAPLWQTKSAPAPKRFSGLQVPGHLKPELGTPYLCVERGFDPASLENGARRAFAYDLGATVYPKYPGLAGIPNTGVAVAFPLVSYVAPHPMHTHGLSFGTRLREASRSPQDALTRAARVSLSESTENWAALHKKALARPLQGGGIGTASSRRR